MNITETIYQHVKMMPMDKAIEVLHFDEFLETKPDSVANNMAENDLLEFIKNQPIGVSVQIQKSTRMFRH
jgi:hypothetical protein